MSTIIPEAVSYVELKLPLEIPEGDSLSEELSKLILLEIQGKPVEVFEDYPLPILMAAFEVIHKVSPEMVLRLKDGRRILIFDHWGRPVLRNKDILEIKKLETINDNSEEFVSELIIDLENIWQKFKNQEIDVEVINNALEEVNKFLKPSMITILMGKAPALLFLLTQHLFYGKTVEIWYQENLSTKPIRITRR